MAINPIYGGTASPVAISPTRYSRLTYRVSIGTMIYADTDKSLFDRHNQELSLGFRPKIGDYLMCDSPLLGTLVTPGNHPSPTPPAI